MSMMTRAFRSLALAGALALTGVATLPQAQAAEENNIVNGYAVHGYDVVAYFTQGKPTEGRNEFIAQHEGVNYRFASAENRDLFKANPAKYAPQYGGFCAYGAAMGRKFDGDPKAWTIADGKLYLNLNQKVQDRWSKEAKGYIRGADHNWALMRSVADAQLEKDPPKGISLGTK